MCFSSDQDSCEMSKQPVSHLSRRDLSQLEENKGDQTTTQHEGAPS